MKVRIKKEQAVQACPYWSICGHFHVSTIFLDIMPLLIYAYGVVYFFEFRYGVGALCGTFLLSSHIHGSSPQTAGAPPGIPDRE